MMSASGEPALQQELQAQLESKSNEVRVSLLVDEDTVPWGIFTERKFARKPCTSACKRPPVSSLTFGKDFPATDVASKSHRPRSCSRPRNRGDRMINKPFWPKPVVAQDQGRVDCCGRVPGEHPNPRHHPQGQEDRERVCPLSRCTPSSPVLRFPCIHLYVTRGNEEGSCFLEKHPEQEDTPSSPSILMELKFELDTRLTVS